VRLRYAEHCSMRLTPDFTQPVAAGFWLNDGMGNDIVAYHLLPKGGAA
jgi:hypothetical protein